MDLNELLTTLGIKKLIINPFFKLFNIQTDNRKIIKIDKQEIHINIFACDAKQKDQIKKELLQSKKQGGPVLQGESKQLIESINAEYEKDKKLLDFFQDKIPQKDMPILRASLILKNQFNKEKDAERNIHINKYLKQDIVYKYGERGNNIANLCTAGYFEDYIKKLYLELSSQADFDIGQFQAIYEMIINEHPFAIFVNESMGCNLITKKIIDGIIKNKKYGITDLRVHGIGPENIKNIYKVVNDPNFLNNLPSEYQQPNIYKEKKFIIVTFRP